MRPGKSGHSGASVSNVLSAFSGLRWLSVIRSVESPDTPYHIDASAVLQHAGTLEILQIVCVRETAPATLEAFVKQDLKRMCIACQALQFLSVSITEAYLDPQRPEEGPRPFSLEDLSFLVSDQSM